MASTLQPAGNGSAAPAKRRPGHADAAQAAELDKDALALRREAGPAATAARMSQAAEALRAGQHENALALLGDAARRAGATALGGALAGHAARIAGRHPFPEGHAETARRLAGDVCRSGLPAGIVSGVTGSLKSAVRDLGEDRDVHAWYHLRAAALYLSSTGRRPSGTETAFALRAAALRDSVQSAFRARHEAELEADDGVLAHLRFEPVAGGTTWYTVHGTARAAHIAEHAAGRGGKGVLREAPDEAAMSDGARNFRACALARGWNVSYRATPLRTRAAGGQAGGIREDLSATHPVTRQVVALSWAAGREAGPGGETLSSAREKIAAKPGRRSAPG